MTGVTIVTQSCSDTDSLAPLRPFDSTSFRSGQRPSISLSFDSAQGAASLRATPLHFAGGPPLQGSGARAGKNAKESLSHFPLRGAASLRATLRKKRITGMIGIIGGVDRINKICVNPCNLWTEWAKLQSRQGLNQG